MTTLSDQEIAQDLRYYNMPVHNLTIAAGKAAVLGFMRRQSATPEYEQAGQVFTGLED